jgi:hypothetical protein
VYRNFGIVVSLTWQRNPQLNSLTLGERRLSVASGGAYESPLEDCHVVRCGMAGASTRWTCDGVLWRYSYLRCSSGPPASPGTMDCQPERRDAQASFHVSAIICIDSICAAALQFWTYATTARTAFQPAQQPRGAHHPADCPLRNNIPSTGEQVLGRSRLLHNLTGVKMIRGCACRGSRQVTVLRLPGTQLASFTRPVTSRPGPCMPSHLSSPASRSCLTTACAICGMLQQIDEVAVADDQPMLHGSTKGSKQ